MKKKPASLCAKSFWGNRGSFSQASYRSDQGRHHAWDIFATIVRMDEDDWKKSQEHNDLHKKENYLQNAKQIQEQCFTSKDSIGFIRMREHQTFQRTSEIYEPHLEKVVEDIKDLFKF